MSVIGAVAAGGAPFVVAAGAGGGAPEVDEVPTYVLPGRCESVRNCVYRRGWVETGWFGRREEVSTRSW
jgi:hypothetical protein